jgi:hypothetical protein
MAFMAPILAGVGEAAGTVGSALGSAASGIGSTLAGTAGELGSLFGGGGGAVGGTGLGAIGEGLSSLVTGGAEAAPGFVGPPAALAGPAVTGPGFASGLLQGYLGTLGEYAAPSAGTQLGGGLGQLVTTLQGLHGGSAAAPPMQPIVRPYPMPTAPATQLLPASMLASPSGAPGQGPIMKMIGQLFAGF